MAVLSGALYVLMETFRCNEHKFLTCAKERGNM